MIESAPSLWIVSMIVAAVISGGWGGYVSKCKNREPVEGIAMGLTMGPFGVIVAACLPTLEPREAAVESEDFLDANQDALARWLKAPEGKRPPG